MPNETHIVIEIEVKTPPPGFFEEIDRGMRELAETIAEGERLIDALLLRSDPRPARYRVAQ